MKISNIDAATVVRDSGMDAMSALNEILIELSSRISVEEEKAVRLAIATSMDAILVNLVNPVLRDYPALEVEDAKWGEIALTRARMRCSRRGAEVPQDG